MDRLTSNLLASSESTRGRTRHGTLFEKLFRSRATSAICVALGGWFLVVEQYGSSFVPSAVYSLTVGGVAVGPLVVALSHESVTHLLENVAVLAAFGWKFERYESRYRYLAFFVLVAYVSVRVERFALLYLAQIPAVTIGASGGVLAIATSVTVRSWPSRKVLYSSGDDSLRGVLTALARTPSALLLVVGTVAITTTVLGEFLTPTGQVAKYAHLTGVFVGGAHGAEALRRDH